MNNDKQNVAENLSKFLANNYALYLKTQNFHWNVRGSLFHTLHEMFESQYKELAESVDGIAERIRALGMLAPGSFTKFAELSTLEEANSPQRASEMIQTLIADHETLIQQAKRVANVAAESDDEVTEDMMVERVEWHEKTNWMLRSLLED